MLIAVTSDTNLGATFLDWSIHWLSGQQQHYHIISQQYNQLTANPVTQDNAHGHKKNHSLGLPELKTFVDKLTQESQPFVTVYPGLTEPDSIDNVKASDWDQVESFHRTEFQQIWKYINERFSHHIHIANEPSIPLYHLQPRVDSRWMLRLGNGQSPAKTYQEIFFAQSQQRWQTLGLTDIWDIRERMALDIRPFKVHTPVDLADYSQPHLWINCMEFWCMGKDTMQRVFDFLNLDMDHTRVDTWQDVYNTWQLRQMQHVRRCWQIPHIVESVVNNYYYPLPTLSLLEEAVIQHCLIYQHNLNLKTWQLVQFPDNTQKLHQLLEPNCHTVKRLY